MTTASCNSNNNDNSVVPPNFDSIPISTKTIIASTNMEININDCFINLPITPFIFIKKKRGRKKKEVVVDPNKDIPEGSIITLLYKDKVRGIDLKNKKNKKKNFFRNALTVVMIIDHKLLNFKIPTNGKFQITGCKKNKHAELCVKYMINYFNSIEINKKINIYKINGNHFKVIFIIVMTNIDFNVGFLINRENLDRLINRDTAYNSLLETSFGYTGVNIKFPMNKIQNLSLKTLEYIKEDDKWVKSNTSFEDHINSLSVKDQEKESKKKRYVTFLVFHSGNVIMSGMIVQFMKPLFQEFIEIIKNNKHIIEEKLDI